MLADFAAQTLQQQVTVLLDNTALAGYAVSYPVEEAYFLENIAINPHYQSRGCGTLLLQHVHTLAREFGLVKLYTNEKMHENLLWYQRHGYVETDRCVEDGFARVFMEKKLISG